MEALVNVSQKKVIAHKVRYCDSFFSRLKGLLGTKELSRDEACWLIPCNMVHTFGLGYSIDVVFLDKKNEIVSVIQNLKPNRLSPLVRGAHSAVEFASGTQERIRRGEILSLELSA